LRDDKLDEARGLLADAQHPAHELNAEEVARVSIEEALIASHRNVFGVIVWFVLFSALGWAARQRAAVRLGQFLHSRWGDDSEDELGQFGGFARARSTCWNGCLSA